MFLFGFLVNYLMIRGYFAMAVLYAQESYTPVLQSRGTRQMLLLYLFQDIGQVLRRYCSNFCLVQTPQPMMKNTYLKIFDHMQGIRHHYFVFVLDTLPRLTCY